MKEKMYYYFKEYAAAADTLISKLFLNYCNMIRLKENERLISKEGEKEEKNMEKKMYELEKKRLQIRKVIKRITIVSFVP